jgi:hypothetical protein
MMQKSSQRNILDALQDVDGFRDLAFDVAGVDPSLARAVPAAWLDALSLEPGAGPGLKKLWGSVLAELPVLQRLFDEHLFAVGVGRYREERWWKDPRVAQPVLVYVIGKRTERPRFNVFVRVGHLPAQTRPQSGAAAATWDDLPEDLHRLLAIHNGWYGPGHGEGFRQRERWQENEVELDEEITISPLVDVYSNGAGGNLSWSVPLKAMVAWYASDRDLWSVRETFEHLEERLELELEELEQEEKPPPPQGLASRAVPASRLQALRDSLAALEETLGSAAPVDELLRPGATAAELGELSSELCAGGPVPDEVRLLYEWHNGQVAPGGGLASLPWSFLSIARAIEAYQGLVDDELSEVVQGMLPIFVDEILQSPVCYDAREETFGQVGNAYPPVTLAEFVRDVCEELLARREHVPVVLELAEPGWEPMAECTESCVSTREIGCVLANLFVQDRKLACHLFVKVGTERWLHQQTRGSSKDRDVADRVRLLERCTKMINTALELHARPYVIRDGDVAHYMGFRSEEPLQPRDSFGRLQGKITLPAPLETRRWRC